MNNKEINGTLGEYLVTVTTESKFINIKIPYDDPTMEDAERITKHIGFKPDPTDLDKMCERYPSLADEFKAVHKAGVNILDAGDLRCAFTWGDTPQGHEFWNGAFKALGGGW